MSITITDVDGLQAMNDDKTEDYVLGNNIDASDTATWNANNGFIPIGNHTTPFTGTFNGAGYTISDLYIERSGANYIGLFGEINGATIQNVTLASPTITGDAYTGALVGFDYSTSTISNCIIFGGSVTGDAANANDIGGLIGHADSSVISDCYTTCTVFGDNNAIGGIVGSVADATFEDCYATGAVSGNTTDSTGVGGFVGEDGGGGTFTSCYATGAITGYDSVGGFAGEASDSTITSCYATGAITGIYRDIGGFIGETDNSGTLTISKCYSTGAVSAHVSSGYNAVGGFIGIGGTDVTIANCYSRSAVDGGSADAVAGFAGDPDNATYTNCYSTGAVTNGDDDVGGFSGYLDKDATVTSCYWDTETSGQATSSYGTGKTTVQMNYQLTFSGWDFATIWAIDASHNNNYPYLGVGGVIGRCYTISDLFDEKGRVPKGARVLAYRSDTHELIKEGTIDANGNATICGLPLDTDVSFHVTWGGATSGENNRWFYSDISGVVEGGTGSSTASGSATNLGLGTGDSPQFAGVNVGHASDTTIARESAGRISVEGNVLVRPASFVVAANDAPLQVKKQADYVCDATDDHVQIQAAIDALPAEGGSVLLSQGTFNIESAITLDSYQTLRGYGRSTILTTTTADLDIITATGSNGSEKVGILIADLCIDGDAGSAANDTGIVWTYVDDSKILNIWVQDCAENGIKLSTSDHNTIANNWIESCAVDGMYLVTSTYNTFANNNASGNTSGGIDLDTSSHYNTICYNVCEGNTIEGIYLNASEHNTISGNNCEGNGESGIILTNSADNNTVLANVCKGGSEYGIYVDGSDHNTVWGNICNGYTLNGIFVEGSSYCSISINICNGNDRLGIYVYQANHNIIIGNSLTENSQGADNTYDDINIEDSDYNTIQGNLCRAGGETNKPKYGINVADASSDANKVINNDLYDDGFGTAPFNDSGTGTIYLEPEDTRDFLKYFGDRTILTGGGITATSPADGTVAVATCTAQCKETDSDTADGVFFSYAGTTGVSLTDVTANLLYLDYNAGTPQVVVATSVATYGFKQDHILLGAVFRNGNDVHIVDSDRLGIQLANRAHITRVEEGAQRTSGMATTVTGTRNLTIDSGILHLGLIRQATLAYDTSRTGTADQDELNKLHDADSDFTTGDVGKHVHNVTDDIYGEVTAFVDSGELTLLADTFPDGNEAYTLDHWTYWYYDGDLGTPAWVQVKGSTQISNTQYNAVATGLANLTANKYGVHWVYMDFSGHPHIVYGQGDYTANQAEEATVPASLPNVTLGFSVIIAKIICQQGTDTLTITYPWTTVFTSSLATDHGSLAGLADDDHSQYLLVADLENPPTEDESTKAPTSEWAFDHNAAVLSTTVHDNDNWFSGYSAETIAGLPSHAKCPTLTAISDPSSMLTVADWYGASGAYRQSDADSDATHIRDDDANFPDSIEYSIVKWASNAAGDTNTGIGVIYTPASTEVVIKKCSGVNFAGSYYYWIKHSEIIIPVTGLYLVTGGVLFLPAEVDKNFQVRIYTFSGTGAIAQVASGDLGSPLATYSQPIGSWLIPLTATHSLFFLANHNGTEGTPTLYYGAPSHSPLAIFLLKQTA